MKRKMNWLAVMGMMSCLAVGTQARADLVTFTDEASFLSAAGPTTLEDFNSTEPQNFGTPTQGVFVAPFSNFIASGNSNGDFVSVAPGTFGGNIDGTNFFYFGQVDPNTGGFGDGGAGPTFTYTFAAPTTAFGFDFTDTDPTDSYRLTINESNFENPPFFSNPNFEGGLGTGSGFFGVVASNGETFTSATFTQNERRGFISPFGIDNVLVSAAAAPEPAPVPEPGTMALMGIGLASLVAARRRKKEKLEA